MGLGSHVPDLIRASYDVCVWPKLIDPTLPFKHQCTTIQEALTIGDPTVWKREDLTNRNTVYVEDSTGSWRSINTDHIKNGEEFMDFVRNRMQRVMTESSAKIAIFRMDHKRNELPAPKQVEHALRYGDPATEEGREKLASNAIKWDEIEPDPVTGKPSLFHRNQPFPKNFNSIFGDPVARLQFDETVLKAARCVDVPAGKYFILDGVTGQDDVRQFNHYPGALKFSREEQLEISKHYLPQAEADVGIIFHMDRILRERSAGANPLFFVHSEDTDVLLVLLLYIHQRKTYEFDVRWEHKKCMYSFDRGSKAEGNKFSKRINQYECVDVRMLYDLMEKDLNIVSFCAFLLMNGSDYTRNPENLGFLTLLESYCSRPKEAPQLVVQSPSTLFMEISFEVYESIIMEAYRKKYPKEMLVTLEDVVTHTSKSYTEKSGKRAVNTQAHRVRCAQIAWALNYYMFAWDKKKPFRTGLETKDRCSLYGYRKATYLDENGRSQFKIVHADRVLDKLFY